MKQTIKTQAQKKATGPSARNTAYQILLTFEQKKSRLDDLLADALSRHSYGEQDRRFLKNLTSGVVRHLRYLDWMTSRFYRGNYKKALHKFKTVMRLAFYEILFLDGIPEHATLNEYVGIARKKISMSQSKVVNGILRNYLRAGEKPDPQKEITDPVQRIGIQYSFPEWLVKRWISFWGEQEVEALCQSMNQPPRFDLRIIEKNISKDDFKKMLEKEGVSFTESSCFENMLTVSDLQPLISAGWFDRGLCAVQDESAAIPVEMLNIQPADLVLDVCAAPGGKFTQILQHQSEKGLALAMDIDLKRLKRVRANVERLGLKKGFYVVGDAERPPFRNTFDKILIDAPCSGLGVIRKHPDIKWRRSFKELVEFSRLQERILRTMGGLLKEAGQMVYSTCTIDPFENDNVVQPFADNPSENVKLLDVPEKFTDFKSKKVIRTFPHRHQTDGSFCAAFQKKSYSA